ncbi:DUF5979 domain-containing protein [Nocardioides sp.]|uniref:DUF5979 domain-containing protein n=1 Tax=Nocardioides sp. TaxID=35761 RepID=UPI003783E189
MVGFSVTFTAPGNGIEPSAYAVLPYTVAADPVSGTVPVTATNTTSTEVTDVLGRTGDDSAQATIDRLPVQIDTAVSKSFTPAELYAAPGATTLVSLAGAVSPRPDSTIGSDSLTITDPADPSGTPSDFWSCFTVRNITNTDVPAGTTLTVEYWDGSSWHTLASQTGPTSNWSYVVPSGTRDVLQGLRFRFEPTTPGAVLPPGFNVAPNFNATVRAGADCTAIASDETVTNDVRSDVVNAANAVDATAVDDADLLLHSTSGGGGSGPDLVDKTWVDPDDPSTDIDPVTVGALSGEVRTAKLRWSTGGLAFDSVAITDPATTGELTDVTTSIYDAFDLDKILPITAAQDPHMVDDRVSKVELYSTSTSAWVDVTAAACAAGCTGQFGGYDVPAGTGVGQEDDVVGVRLTFVSRTSGEPVSISSAHDRLVRLDLRVRDRKRVPTGTPDEDWVLGQHHDGMTYNTGTPGLVENTVRVAGTGAYDWASTDSADAVIIDKPLNVELTKSFEYSPLGLPPDGTPQADYPLVDAVLQATNKTASRVSQLKITDPSPGTAEADSVFDTLDLFGFVAIDLPPGVPQSGVSVVLTHAGGGTTTHTYAQALALTPADLVDVVGVEVTADGVIQSAERLGLRLVFQLRSTQRDSGDPMTVTTSGVVRPVHLNVAQADVYGPGGISCALYGPPCDNVQDTADDQFQIDPVTYDVVATKVVNPASRYEDEPRTGYVASLTGQPTGSARTSVLTLTDDEPTFWNAFDFSAIEPFTPVGPVNQLRLSVLTGVEYSLSGSDLVATCNNLTDLTGCWTTGAWTDPVGGTISLALPAGVDPATVRGIRVEARSIRDGAPVGWERPNNQKVTLRLDVTRRVNLWWSPAGSDTTPVPSTLPGMTPAPGEPTQGTIHDTLDVHGVASWSPGGTTLQATDSASATTQLRHRVNKIRVEKKPGNGSGPAPLYGNGETVPFQMVVTNTGAYTMTAPSFTVTDQIQTVGGQSPVTAPAGDASFGFALVNGSGTGQSVAGITGHLDETTGLVTVSFPAGFTFPPGWKLTVSADLKVRADVPAGTEIDNSVTASADRDFEECKYTVDDGPLQTSGSAAVPVPDCTASTTVEVRAEAPLQTTKSVKGVAAGVPGASPGDPNYDDLGVLAADQPDASACSTAARDAQDFYTYPCVPITRPGGTERWRIDLENDGNVNATVVAGIDVLPHLNDQGVVVPTPRGSEWAPTLVGNFASNAASLADGSFAQFALYYLTTVPDTDCNDADIRSATQPGGLAPADPCAADVAARDWRPTAGATPAELAQAKALKLVLTFSDPGNPAASPGLRPGEVLALSFDTTTAAYPGVATARDDDLSIAWNSVAGGSRIAAAGNQAAHASLVTEPRQVGVAMPTGRFDITKVVDAPGWPSGATLPDSYDFTVTCDSAGVTDIPLVDVAGDDASSVTVPADDTVHYNGGASPATAWSHVSVPWNAHCRVQETTVPQGAQVSYDPPGGTVTADTDLTGVPNIDHPFPPSGTGVAEVTATNTYTSGGFTVTKAVDDGGAVDQDGDPITYGPFDFTATCTFHGQEVLDPADQDFSLDAGDSHEVSDLPSGSTCTVTEVGTDGAASTSISAVQGGTTIPGTGSSVDFDVVEGDVTATAVTATNTYTTGSLLVTKTVNGPGADLWGNESFTLHLQCTLDGDTVYDGDSPAVDKTHPTWTVDHLPSGADCVVSEVRTGGANDTTLDPADGRVTIGDATTVEVGVENTFTLGSLTVTKDLTGPAAGVPGAVNGRYTVELTCTRDVDGADVPVDIPGGAQQVIIGEGSVTYDDLPTGARCSVAEVDSVPSTPDVVVSPSSVVVGDDPSDPVEVLVTNDFHDGALQVSKQVDGDAAAAAPDTFDVTVACEFPAGVPVPLPDDGAVTLDRDGTPVTLAGIPTGAVCTVTEADAGQTEVSFAPSDTVTVGDGTTTEVVVTNTYRSGALVVRKHLEGVGAGVAQGPFVFGVSCTFLGNQVTDTSVTLTSGPGSDDLVSDPVTDIPVGSTCTVTETDAGNAVRPSPPVDVIIVDGSVTVPVEAEQTNRFGAGVLHVGKTVDGPYADDPDLRGATFPVRVTCEYGDGQDVEQVLDQVVDVPRDRTVTVSGDDGEPVLLPVGARCWGDEEDLGDLAPDEVTVDHGSRADAVEVVADGAGAPVRIGISVVNTYTHPVGVEPSDATTGGGPGELPDTGSPVTPGLVLLGGLLVLVGGALVWRSRVHR